MYEIKANKRKEEGVDKYHNIFLYSYFYKSKKSVNSYLYKSMKQKNFLKR